jgi:hypothetical protein
MAKNKVNENNEFSDDDGDIEQDMKTLGQVRDTLFADFKASRDVVQKVSIAQQISSVVKMRQESELFLLRVTGFFDRDSGEDDYCEGCPECDPEMKKGNDEAN